MVVVVMEWVEVEEVGGGCSAITMKRVLYKGKW